MENDFGLGYAMGQSEGNKNCGGDGMFGGNGSWIFAFLIIALIFGGRGLFGGGSSDNGGGGAMNLLPYVLSTNSTVGASGALTRADLCQDMNFQSVQNGVRNVSDAVNLGFANLNSTICNQQYETAGLINGLQGTIQGGFNAANIVALQNQNALQTQIANCCCENREGQAQIRYDMATNTCALQTSIANSARDIIDSQNAGTRAILDKMCQQELAAKDAQIAALNQQLFRADLAASQQSQSNYIVGQLAPKAPVASFTVPNPFTGQYGPYAYGQGYGPYYGQGCGCNTCCTGCAA